MVYLWAHIFLITALGAIPKEENEREVRIVWMYGCMDGTRGGKWKYIIME